MLWIDYPWPMDGNGGEGFVVFLERVPLIDLVSMRELFL